MPTFAAVSDAPTVYVRGDIDTLIAATALERNLTVVTIDTDFQRSQPTGDTPLPHNHASPVKALTAPFQQFQLMSITLFIDMVFYILTYQMCLARPSSCVFRM